MPARGSIHRPSDIEGDVRSLAARGHYLDPPLAENATRAPPLSKERLDPVAATTNESRRAARLRDIFEEHVRLVWRTLRRFGVSGTSADDATQSAFLVLHAHLDRVTPGQERAFLIGVCSRVAANARRADQRQRERETSSDVDAIDERGLTPEQLLEYKERRKVLDHALNALSHDQRTVFVLFELEGFTLPEVAESLQIPLGTATSRLLRARKAFEEWVSAHQPGGTIG